jgi:hypothetical protein
VVDQVEQHSQWQIMEQRQEQATPESMQTKIVETMSSYVRPAARCVI